MSEAGWGNEWTVMAERDLTAAEKFLKGVLVSFDMEPPKTHDLIRLCKLCCESDSSFEQLADACVELTPYGVQVRYPSDLELEEIDMKCALRECSKIRDFVLNYFERNNPERR